MTWANMLPMGFNLPRGGLQAAGPQQLSLGMAGVAGLEPVTSAVTGQRSNQLSYTPANEAAGLVREVHGGSIPFSENNGGFVMPK